MAMKATPASKKRIGRCVCCPAKVIEARGLCRPCYLAALQKVSDGEATWQGLIDAGLAAKHQPKATGFERRFEAAKQHKK